MDGLVSRFDKLNRSGKWIDFKEADEDAIVDEEEVSSDSYDDEEDSNN